MGARLDALGAFTLALEMLQAGRELLERLGLDATANAATHLRARGAVPGSLTLLRFAEERTVGARVVLVLGKLAPRADFLRYKYPIARRGRLGLVAAYTWRPLWLCLHAPGAWRAWRGAEAAARRS